MPRRLVGSTVLVATLFVGISAVFADPPSPSPATIDWRDLVDDDGDGDYVVGEEMCVLPARPTE